MSTTEYCPYTGDPCTSKCRAYMRDDHKSISGCVITDNEIIKNLYLKEIRDAILSLKEN